MSAKSIEKSPSVLGVYFYAVLMALFGGLLGFVYMTTFPAQAFASEAEYQASVESPEGAEDSEGTVYAKPGDAYYIEGPVARSRSWEAKRDQISAPGEQVVRLSTGEMNGWMAAKFRPGAGPSGEDAPDVLIVPGVPNLALLEDGRLYLNLPTTMSAYEASHDYTVSALCEIDASGLSFQSVKVSSARVPLPQILGAKVMKTLAQSYQSTEEYAIVTEALERAESIEVENGELVIRLR